MTEESDRFSWVKPLIQGAAAMGAVAAAVTGYIAATTERAPERNLRPGTADDRRFEAQLHDLAVEFGQRVAALELWKAQHQEYSTERSAQLKQQIERIQTDMDRMMSLIEANRSRLDRIVDTPVGPRR